MKILILGGAGFIGSRTARRLSEHGHDVTVADSFDPQIHGEDLAKSPTLQTILGRIGVVAVDVRDAARLSRALDGVDTILHFAAGTGTGQSMYQIHHYADVNVGGTARVAEEIIRRKGQFRRVVVSSSRAVYGEGAALCAEHGRVFPDMRDTAAMEGGQFETVCPHCAKPVSFAASLETDANQPTSIYGITKLAQEQLLLNAARAAGVPAVALRYQNVFGPGQSLKNPYTGILSIFSQLIRDGREVNLFEDGLATRDFVFIDDVVHYNVEATVQELAGTHVLNVGTGVRQTLVDVVTTLAAVTGRPPKYRISGQFRLGDIRHAAASTDRVARTLGAHPFVSFADGVRQFVEWTEGLASESQSESRYRNSLDEMKSLGLLRGGASVPS